MAVRGVLHEVAKGAAFSERELLRCVLGARGRIGEGAGHGPALPLAHTGGSEAEHAEGCGPAEDAATAAERTKEPGLVCCARDARFGETATECGDQCEEETDHGTELGVRLPGLSERDLELDQLLVLGVEGHHVGCGTRDPGAAGRRRDVLLPEEQRVAALRDGHAEPMTVGSAGCRHGHARRAVMSVWAH